MKEVWQKELRKVYYLNSEKLFVEKPTLDEYYSRLMKAGMFDKKSKKSDKNSVGSCWFRSYAGDQDISRFKL